MQKPPRSSPMVAAATGLRPSPPMVSGSPSTLCEITIRLIYLSCVRMDRICDRLPAIPNRTGNRNGSRSPQSLCIYESRWRAKRLYHSSKRCYEKVFILSDFALPPVRLQRTALQYPVSANARTASDQFAAAHSHAVCTADNLHPKSVRDQYPGADQHSFHGNTAGHRHARPNIHGDVSSHDHDGADRSQFIHALSESFSFGNEKHGTDRVGQYLSGRCFDPLHYDSNACQALEICHALVSPAG